MIPQNIPSLAVTLGDCKKVVSYAKISNVKLKGLNSVEFSTENQFSQ